MKQLQHAVVLDHDNRLAMSAALRDTHLATHYASAVHCGMVRDGLPGVARVYSAVRSVYEQPHRLTIAPLFPRPDRPPN